MDGIEPAFPVSKTRQMSINKTIDLRNFKLKLYYLNYLIPDRFIDLRYLHILSSVKFASRYELSLLVSFDAKSLRMHVHELMCVKLSLLTWKIAEMHVTVASGFVHRKPPIRATDCCAISCTLLLAISFFGFTRILQLIIATVTLHTKHIK